jgi:hypothetical protein
MSLVNYFKLTYTYYSSSGLTDYGLSKVFGSKISSPHSLMVTEDTYAGLILGFPELEFSPSEVHVWQRPKESTIGNVGCVFIYLCKLHY